MNTLEPKKPVLEPLASNVSTWCARSRDRRSQCSLERVWALSRYRRHTPRPAHATTYNYLPQIVHPDPSHSQLIELKEQHQGAIAPLAQAEIPNERIESTDLLESLAHNLPFSLVMFDRQMHYLLTSQLWKKNYNLLGENLIGQLHYDVFPKIPDHWKQVHQNCLAGDVVKCEEELVYHADGTSDWERWEVRPWYDQAGEIGGIMIFTEVINDRKAAQDALKQSQAQLEEKAQQLEETLNQLRRTQSQIVQSEKMSSLGLLVAGIAHEINNPVNFIHGNLTHAASYLQNLLDLVELYQECYPEPVARIQEFKDEIDYEFVVEDLLKLFASMRMGTERIRAIVLSLRNFSRTDESEFKTVDIHEGLDSTLLILQSRLKPNGDRPIIQVIKDYGSLPLVSCFPGQLNQVFMNILANAIDALEEQGVGRQPSASWPSQASDSVPCIRIRTEHMENDRVLIRIADNGPGIPEHIQHKLFDPFFTTKEVGKGTGLGLSISYQIVTERHQGRLQCHSTPGQGSEFVIEIPVNLLDK